MQNELKVLGTQEFMGREIPSIVGGFGEDCKVVTDKMVAEIHGVTTSNVRKAINRNISRFKADIDIIDLKSPSSNDDLVLQLGYSNQQVLQAKNIYLLSERGYAKLIKIMDTDLAWEIHDRLVDEYFTMQETIKEMANMLTQEEILGLAIFKAKTREEALVAASELDRFRKEQIAIAEKIIEEQKPLVNLCLKRRSSEGLVTFDDIKDTYGLRHGQIGTWLRNNGYIHMTRNEVNEKGRGICQVYGKEYPSVGITEDGVRFIDEHINEIRLSPCRKSKKSA